ncbi:MAG: hypothetical protein NTZ42_04140 [Candidatus Gribaldobacteria bacterium]|nr:hypothetical protein [Candidatus Gribaldobacteria bacterium]
MAIKKGQRICPGYFLVIYADILHFLFNVAAFLTKREKALIGQVANFFAFVGKPQSFEILFNQIAIRIITKQIKAAHDHFAIN